MKHVAIFVLSFSLGCGGDDTSNVPGDGAATDEDASTTPDGSVTPPTDKARVSFVGAMSVAVADRRTFEARLDGAALTPAFDDHALTSQTPVFHPGTSTGYVELEPGTHTLSLSASFTAYQCINPPTCTEQDAMEAGGSASVELEAIADTSYFVVFALDAYTPAPYIPAQAIAGVGVHASTATRTPEGNVFAGIFLRRPEGPNDRDLIAATTLHGACDSGVGATTVAPGEHFAFNFPPDADLDLILTSGVSPTHWHLPPFATDPQNLPRSPEALPIFTGPSVPSSGSGPGVLLTEVLCGG